MHQEATLLVIDDDAVTCETICSLLADDGYQFIVAANGLEGLARARADDPDVILLDVMMPGMSGFEVCRRLRRDAHLAAVPILMLSALEDRASRLEGLDAGADDFISKPFDSVELRTRLKAITRLNRYRRLEAERTKFQQSETRFRTLVEHLPQRVFLKDRQSVYLACNRGFARDLGLEPEAVVGKTDYELFPTPVAEKYQADDQRVMASGSLETLEEKYTRLEQDGWFQSSKIPYRDEHGNIAGVFGILEDITERKKAELERQRLLETLEQRVADRTRELAALYAVATVANEALELQVMLDKMLAQALAAVGVPRGAIHLLEPGGDRLYLAAQAGIPPEIETRIKVVTPGFGLTGWVVKRNQPLTLTNMSSDPRILTIGQVSGLSVYLSVPLRAHSQLLGVISVFGDTEQRLNPETMALLTTIADQIGLALEGMRLRQQAQQAAVLEERQRVARELHDSVTQALYSLTLLASAGQRAAQDGSLERTRRHLDRIYSTVVQSLKEMRLLVYELQPSTLGIEGLVAALRRRLEVVENHANVQTELQVESQAELPAAVEMELYGLAQEALNNALKHADATTVTVRLTDSADWIVMEVGDNGRGFDPQVGPSRQGLGLTNMRERAARVGGALEIVTAPGKGTSVKIKVPRGTGGRSPNPTAGGSPSDDQGRAAL